MQLLLLLPALAALEYPLSFATLRQVELHRSPDELARLMGVPGPQGISISTNYQYVALDGWTFGKGLKGACHLWTNAEKYFGKLSRFGTTTSDIQSYLRKLYNQAGTKLLATAFSTYEFPVTERVDAKTAADKLALFVRTNNFDGAVLQFQDVGAIVGEDTPAAASSNWLVSFLSQLRQQLPAEILVLHTYASLFQPSLQLSQFVGDLSNNIDFFVMKYYDLIGDYTNVESTFNAATSYKGTSVQELMTLGVRGNMLVVGKPCSLADTWSNQTFIEAALLAQAMGTAYSKLGWYGGYACNDFSNDLMGVFIQAATSKLIASCDDSGQCM